MKHALVRHIVRQGAYNSKDIAVLTPYVGQLQKLRAAMRHDFEIVLGERDQDTFLKDGFVDENLSSGLDSNQAAGPILQKKAIGELLRIRTVDNFQGEEAKIIIVSRTKQRREEGRFLRTTNRINVLLSRAQHGMIQTSRKVLNSVVVGTSDAKITAEAEDSERCFV